MWKSQNILMEVLNVNKIILEALVKAFIRDLFRDYVCGFVTQSSTSTTTWTIYIHSDDIQLETCCNMTPENTRRNHNVKFTSNRRFDVKITF